MFDEQPAQKIKKRGWFFCLFLPEDVISRGPAGNRCQVERDRMDLKRASCLLYGADMFCCRALADCKHGEQLFVSCSGS